MKKIIIICFFAFLYSSSAVVFPSYYIPPLHFGPIFGMTFYSADNNIDFKNRELLTKNLPELKGHSYSYGLSFFYFLDGYVNLYGEPVTGHWNFSMDLTYNSNFLSSKSSITNPGMNNRLLNLNGNENDSSGTILNYSNETEYSQIEFDYYMSYQIFEKIPIHVNFNVGFQFAVENNIQEYLEISSDNNKLKFKEIENIKLENDNRKLILIDGEIPEFNLLLITVGIGASYDLIRKSHSFLRFNYTFRINPLGFQKHVVNNYFIHKLGIAWYFVI